MFLSFRSSCVLQSVTVNRAQALEPIDTFQSPLSSPLASPRSRRQPSQLPSPRASPSLSVMTSSLSSSKLACISENEQENDDDDDDDDGVCRTPLSAPASALPALQLQQPACSSRLAAARSINRATATRFGRRCIKTRAFC